MRDAIKTSQIQVRPIEERISNRGDSENLITEPSIKMNSLISGNTPNPVFIVKRFEKIISNHN